MKYLIQASLQQPLTVAAGVIVLVLAGILSLTGVPIQMTPEVDSVVASVTTSWENAAPEEIEVDVIETQEAQLGDLTNLVSMTSISQTGQGQIRLEFKTGTDIDAAVAEIVQKLDEVPAYPDGVSEPVVEDIDPDSADYIAWVGLSSTDPEFDTTTLFDFMNRRLRPRFERIEGVSEVGILGAREAELHVLVDPVALAQRGLRYSQLVEAIQLNNANFSGGRLEEGKSDLRIRATGRFSHAAAVEDLPIWRGDGPTVYVRDVAEVREAYKEITEWVRARGHAMPFFNYKLESGANLLETMDAIQAEVRHLNQPDGLLQQHAAKLGLDGELELVQTYDATTYVRDAIDLVRGNIVIGGILAILTLLLFLRSLRTIGVIGIAIPISIFGAVVVLMALGRSINIISLAGMAFAVGMVVDNAIVVIENIFRHLEKGKRSMQAALDGAAEVGGAVLASTATTLVVFVPIILIQDSAGQLFRDIALAIMASVSLSLLVSLTVIPTASAAFFRRHRQREPEAKSEPANIPTAAGWWSGLNRRLRAFGRAPQWIADLVGFLIGTWPRRVAVIGSFLAVTAVGTWILIPPMDYVPRGNRNIVFGMLFPPPGYSTEQLSEIGARIEERVRPAWERSDDKFVIESVVRGESEKPDEDRRVPLPMAPGSEETVLPPSIDHYFIGSWDGQIFHLAISEDKKRVVDALPLMNFAASGAATPDVFAFSFQFPLFQTGGSTGSAIKIDLSGDDLEQVSSGAGALLMELISEYGPQSVNPEPANFLLPTPELRIEPIDERLRELGLTRSDVGFAVQANGDGLRLRNEYQMGGQLKDLKIISPASFGADPIQALLATPIATPDGSLVDLRSVAKVTRSRAPEQIKHVDRLRAVTLQLTPPTGLPLEEAIAFVNGAIEKLRRDGAIAPTVEVNLAGSAGKLAEIRRALLGDGSFAGLFTSSLFLALFVVYLVMVVLFQSWSYPLVIMASVPLATFGGFLGLATVHYWSVADRYMPVQNLDVLTILGFVILAGVVVNNAILIVHQTLNFLRDKAEAGEPRPDPLQAIKESVESRVRPIFMASLTSIGGMLPLVLMPGSGSELYRGLGAVVVGGLGVSTVFTLVLVPAILSAVFALQKDPATAARRLHERPEPEWPVAAGSLPRESST